MKYVRTLTSSEASRHFVHIDYIHRSDFPPLEKKFTVRYEDKELECRIDAKNRLWLGHGSKIDWKRTTIELQKHSDNLFSLHQ